jgi:hypothetical protein
MGSIPARRSVVIVGGGISGLFAALTLLEEGDGGRFTVISLIHFPFLFRIKILYPSGSCMSVTRKNVMLALLTFHRRTQFSNHLSLYNTSKIARAEYIQQTFSNLLILCVCLHHKMTNFREHRK